MSLMLFLSFSAFLSSDCCDILVFLLFMSSFSLCGAGGVIATQNWGETIKSVALAIAKSLYSGISGGIFRRTEEAVIPLNDTGVDSLTFERKCNQSVAMVLAYKSFFSGLDSLAMDFLDEANLRVEELENMTLATLSGYNGVVFNTTALDTPSTNNETEAINSVNSSKVNLNLSSLESSEEYLVGHQPATKKKAKAKKKSKN
jgi:hypothetical protein